jgi:predicted amidohydrolase YtcJ
VVLDRDPFAVPPESLAAVRVRYTIVEGRVVYEAEPQPE